MKVAGHRPIIFFDGYCNLCNGSVQFLIHQDPHARIMYASLQSSVAREMLGQEMAEGDPDTVVLLLEGKQYRMSDAVVRCCSVFALAVASSAICKVYPSDPARCYLSIRGPESNGLVWAFRDMHDPYARSAVQIFGRRRAKRRSCTCAECLIWHDASGLLAFMPALPHFREFSS